MRLLVPRPGILRLLYKAPATIQAIGRCQALDGSRQFTLFGEGGYHLMGQQSRPVAVWPATPVHAVNTKLLVL